MSRPSDYTPELAAEICGRLASGSPLSKICGGEENFPSLTTVYRWLQEKPEFRELYARAREDQADTLADEILQIADEDPTTTVIEKTGQIAFDGAAIAHQRLRVDARKWIASKLKPKKYGDRVAQELSGPDGEPMKTSLTVEFVGAAPG